MAVIRYKCDTCKREIELVENQSGLEVMNRCVITDGCRGELYRTDRLQDYIRGQFPARVPGLDDYTPRRVLYNHEQNVAATEWFVEHNLGVAPSLQVLIDVIEAPEEEEEAAACVLRTTDGNTTQVETTDYTVTITGPNTLTITFDDAQSGLAQVLARSSACDVVEETEDEDTPIFALTNDSLLSFATLNSTYSESSTVTVEIVYTPPGSTTTITKSYVAANSASEESPWNDFRTALIQGRRYRVRSFDTFVSEMSDGTIPDGSSWYIGAIDAAPLDDQGVFILLSQSPYDNVDKITDQDIDASTVDASNAELSFFTRDRELYTFVPVITSVFPPIREV